MLHHRAVMETLASLLVVIGLVLLFIGGLAFLVAAFRESILWGLGVFFFSPIALVFLILHWQRAKGAFFLQLYGLGFILAGVILAGEGTPWPFN